MLYSVSLRYIRYAVPLTYGLLMKHSQYPYLDHLWKLHLDILDFVYQGTDVSVVTDSMGKEGHRFYQQPPSNYFLMASRIVLSLPVLPPYKWNQFILFFVHLSEIQCAML